jgi:hypothetical protein
MIHVLKIIFKNKSGRHKKAAIFSWGARIFRGIESKAKMIFKNIFIRKPLYSTVVLSDIWYFDLLIIFRITSWFIFRSVLLEKIAYLTLI